MKIITVCIFVLTAWQNSFAKQSLVYPGVYQATINSVKSANKIVLTIDVWAGFQRQFEIQLPHISIPSPDKNAPMCQLKLIKEGLKFTKNRIDVAEKIEVRNISMSDSTKKLGRAEIYLDDKKLSTQLLAKHFARPDSIEKTKVWCSDEK